MAVDDCNLDTGDLLDLRLDNLEKGSCGSGWQSNFFSELPNSQLCVPSDPIEDLEWFPSFPDDFISLNDVGLMPEHQSYCFSHAKPNQSHENLPAMDFPVTPERLDEIKAKQQTNEVNSKHQNSNVMRKDDGTESLLHGFVGFTRKKARMKSHQKPKCAVTWVKKRCSHCQTEGTPQWRAGPLGPKTLCNACGVRFKSGRLLPEYRPASSPTFDSSRHSNYHKKIMKRLSLQ